MIEAIVSIPAEEAPDPRDRIGLLFDLHHQRLYRLALRMAQNDDEAHDLVQDTFLRVARRPSSIPASEEGAEAWLVRILVNLCRDRFRRQKVRTDNQAEIARADVQRDHEEAVVASQTVRVALAKLSPRRRAVIVMHELEGIDTPAIARNLGVSRVTVRWHLSAARRELAEILAPVGERQ